jgi:hypothetical protein
MFRVFRDSYDFTNDFTYDFIRLLDVVAPSVRGLVAVGVLS